MVVRAAHLRAGSRAVAEISCSRQEQADSRQGARSPAGERGGVAAAAPLTPSSAHKSCHNGQGQRNANACSAGKPNTHRHQAAGVGVGVCASGGIAGASQQAEKGGGLHRSSLWGPAGRELIARRQGCSAALGRRAWRGAATTRRRQCRQRPTSAGKRSLGPDRRPAELQLQSSHDWWLALEGFAYLKGCG